MPNILITGANGQLGCELKTLEQAFPEFRFHFFTRETLDIANSEVVHTTFQSVQPQFCINCAAYTAVDKAENEVEQAFRINEIGVKHLAQASEANGTKLIHISTDYVFDGSGKEPYVETDPTNPVNVYGTTKLAGEKACFAENPESIVIRTSWVYSAFGNNFVKTMLRLMQTRDALNVVADQWGIPTYAAHLALAIMDIIKKDEWKSGLYHFSNAGEPITWYDFAIAIREYTAAACAVNPIPTVEYPTPAKRPFYSVMDSNKIVKTFGIHIPEWKLGLQVCLDQLKVLNCW
jgi:dTDP-4-dehydrorhamnose reductase